MLMTTAEKAHSFFQEYGIPRTTEELIGFCMAYTLADLCRDLVLSTVPPEQQAAELDRAFSAVQFILQSVQ